MPAANQPWRMADGAVILRVRLTPKGGADALEGLAAAPDGPALRARVRAAPEDGAANAALVDLLAGWLGIARRDVALSAGHKSRTKSVRIAGPPAEIEARLRAALSAATAKGRP